MYCQLGIIKQRMDMSEQKEVENIRTTVTVSPANNLSLAELKKFGADFIIFIAPVLVVFFTQLSLGVDWKVAGSVAGIALYQSLANLFKRFKSVDVRLAEGSDLAKDLEDKK